MKLDLNFQKLVDLLRPAQTQSSQSSHSSINNIVIDTRNPRINENTLFIALPGQFANGADFLQDFIEQGGKNAIVTKINPNLKLNQIQVDDALKALQQIAIDHRRNFTYPVIGITGSNGKTIVKEWMYVALKGTYHIVRSPKSYNSQIGVALSVLEMDENHNLAIFEAGISQPGEMELLEKMIQPTIGVFTGIGDAHGINFNSQKEKQEEKFKLFDNAKVVFEPQPDLDEVKHFKSQANKSNASLIVQIGEHLGADTSAFLKNGNHLPELSMRMERHRGINNALLFNDAYSADISSLESALQILSLEKNYENKVLILSKFSDTDFNKEKIGDLLNGANLSQVIYIDEQEVNFGFDNLLHYKNIDSFINSDYKIDNQAVLIKGAHNSGFERLVDYFIEKNHITRLEIDLGAIRSNLGYFKKQLKPGTKILAMVKAQAYGGGIIEVSRLLEREAIDYLGVAYADEGAELRYAGVKTPILVMNSEPHGFEDLITNCLEPSIYSISQLNAFISFLVRKGLKAYPIHIKIDSGMNRLGFKKKGLDDLLDLINTQPEVKVASVFSHLAAADVPSEKEFTLKQLREFNESCETIQKGLGYPFVKHIANTSAVKNYPESHFDMVRIGIGLFGINNSSLQNAVKYISQVSQVKTVLKGESVGYSRSFKAEKEMRIGIVPVGYADGISRTLGRGNYEFYVNGVPCKTVGDICMDMLMIALPSNKMAEGDEVEIFGEYNSVARMAQALNTIPYEVLSGISERVRRVYLES